jgi:glycerol-3-phosphate responsive antiterminator
MNNAILYAFVMRLTVGERVFILESYLKTLSYAHCRQSSFKKFRILKVIITRVIEEINERTLRIVAKNMVKRVDKCIELMYIISNTYCKYRLVV